MTRMSFEELMAVFGGIPVRFWVCPVEGHSDRRGPDGGLVETVRWEGDVARCTAPGCGRPSAARPDAGRR